MVLRWSSEEWGVSPHRSEKAKRNPIIFHHHPYHQTDLVVFTAQPILILIALHESGFWRMMRWRNRSKLTGKGIAVFLLIMKFRLIHRASWKAPSDSSIDKDWYSIRKRVMGIVDSHWLATAPMDWEGDTLIVTFDQMMFHRMSHHACAVLHLSRTVFFFFHWHRFTLSSLTQVESTRWKSKENHLRADPLESREMSVMRVNSNWVSICPLDCLVSYDWHRLDHYR